MKISTQIITSLFAACAVGVGVHALDRRNNERVMVGDRVAMYSCYANGLFDGMDLIRSQFESKKTPQELDALADASDIRMNQLGPRKACGSSTLNDLNKRLDEAFPGQGLKFTPGPAP